MNEKSTGKTKAYNCEYINDVLSTKAGIVSLGWGSSMSCKLYVGSVALIIINTHMAICHRYSGGLSVNQVSGTAVSASMNGDVLTVTKTDGASFTGMIIYTN